MKKICTSMQAQLALRSDEPDTELEAHLTTCDDCSRAARRHTAFDTAVRAALLPVVPDELTARLLALIPGLEMPLIRTKRWIWQRRLILTLGSLLSVLALAVITYGLYRLGLVIGLDQAFATVATWPGAALDWLYTVAPSSRQVVASLLALRQPLQWLALAAVAWLGLEHTAPRRQIEQTLVGN